jgi:hypothetical protein
VSLMMKRFVIFVVIVGSLGVSGWWWMRFSREKSQVIHDDRVSNHVPVRPPEMKSAVVSVSKESLAKNVAGLPSGRNEISKMLEHALSVLGRGQQGESDILLEQLDRMLADGRGNADASIAAILTFLQTGQDAPTGKGFAVGEKGALTQATTLRVYLMNKLGLLSRETGGEAALGVAREVLGSFGSADEWAVSMRNVAWFDKNGREFLQNRVSAMLGHAEWCDSPSVGMLEAFDVIVHTGAVALVPELSRLVAVQNSPLARASSVALDRLASHDARELTVLLNQQPQLLASTPLQRADLFAHADLKISAQREQLEVYLLRTDVSAGERQKFLASLVQSGRFVSYNLVTPLIPPESPIEARERLQTLMRTVNEWKDDARFKGLTSELGTLENKLNRIISEIAAE